MFNQKDVMHLLIGKAGLTASTADPLSYVTDLTDGEIVILDKNNAVLDSGTLSSTTYPTIRFAQRSGTNLIFTPFVTHSKITSIKGQTYVAAAQQVDYIGYNGTSGSLDTTSYNDFIVRILLQDTVTTFGNKQMWKFGAYRSSDSPTQATVAVNLCGNLYDNFRKEPEKIKFELVSDASGTATSAGALTVVNGETVVAWPESSNNNDAGKYNSDGSSIAVGDFIRFGASDTKTHPVYKVVAISGAATSTIYVTLDRPYQGTSGSSAAADTYVFTAASAATANFGIKITGIARTNFRPGVFKYKTPRWSVQLEGFTSTTVTNSTPASDGKGTYEQVAELEWFCQGNEGKIERLGVPPPIMRTDATSGTTYNMITIEYYDDASSSLIMAPVPQKKQLIIAFDSTSANGSSMDVVLTALNYWWDAGTSTILTNIS